VTLILQVMMGVILALLLLAFLPRVLAVGVAAIFYLLLSVAAVVALYVAFNAPLAFFGALLLIAALTIGSSLQGEDTPAANKAKRAAQVAGFYLFSVATFTLIASIITVYLALAYVAVVGEGKHEVWVYAAIVGVMAALAWPLVWVVRAFKRAMRETYPQNAALPANNSLQGRRP
jgi:hypothetical protein